jgi:deazaflavin-dependent oxidoreductase (nitroreductase family)
VTFEKPARGTRGARVPTKGNAFTRFMGRMMVKVHRRSGDRFRGMDVAYLTTVGAKTGEERLTAVTRFPDGDDAWLIVASNSGSARNPSWYHNIAAHPHQVWLEVAGRRFRADVEQLTGERREEAWRRITASQPRYARYQRTTDRPIPVLRLTPA